jgi:hypothetical protein
MAKLLPELKTMEVESIRAAVEKVASFVSLMWLTVLYHRLIIVFCHSFQLNSEVTLLRQKSQRLQGKLEDRVQSARQEVAKQKKALAAAAGAMA